MPETETHWPVVEILADREDTLLGHRVSELDKKVLANAVRQALADLGVDTHELVGALLKEAPARGLRGAVPPAHHLPKPQLKLASCMAFSAARVPN